MIPETHSKSFYTIDKADALSQLYNIYSPPPSTSLSSISYPLGSMI